MSRAFVKEHDNVALESPPELELSAGPNLVTQGGADLIAAKVHQIEAALPATTDEATRNRLARDLRYWLARRNSAQIAPVASGDSVEFGTRVVIERKGRRQTLEIVGEDEADPAQGRVNWRAPLANALLGARKGETVYWDRQPPEEIVVVSIAPL